MKHQQRRPILILATVLSLIGFIFASTVAGAASVTPVEVDGNISCADLNADNTNFPTITSDFGFKLDGMPVNGTYSFTDPPGELTGGAPSDPSNSVTLSNSTNSSFDWSATLGIDAVIVKAGTSANVYVYDPEAFFDDGLVSPDLKDISHIEFCYDYEDPTDTPTVTNTPTETPTNTPTDTPTNTPTDTPTNTPTDTPTNTPTDTPTNTPTDTPTNTPTDTPTNTPTDTPTNTPTNTPTDTPTDTPTNTATYTPTATPTKTTVPDPGLKLVKKASPVTYSDKGQVIVYTYEVTNTGNVTLTGPFMITDDKLGTFQCGSATSLAPGASITCTKSYTIQASDLNTKATVVTSLPNGLPATVTYGMWMQGSRSIMNINLSGLASDAGMPNGLYAGWCIQDHITGQLKNQPAKLYSSIGSSLPADAANLPWNKINYVLNHKIRGFGKTNLQFHQDVQTAIWLLLGEQKPDWGISAQAQQMVNAANANPNYVPGEQDVVAVLVYSDGMGTANPNISKQETIIEVTRRSITNKATATGLFGTTTVTSNEAQATIKQVVSTSKPAPAKTSWEDLLRWYFR